jgi:predicted nuclease of predicted toxin-antitoxin system
MRILVDECAPKALKQAITSAGYECSTVQEMGWSGKRNGDLLGLAEGRFDVLVTVDTNLAYQQNLAARKIGVLLLRARSNKMEDLQPHFPACISALPRVRTGELLQVGG